MKGSGEQEETMFTPRLVQGTGLPANRAQVEGIASEGTRSAELPQPFGLNPMDGKDYLPPYSQEWAGALAEECNI